MGSHRKRKLSSFALIVVILILAGAGFFPQMISASATASSSTSSNSKIPFGIDHSSSNGCHNCTSISLSLSTTYPDDFLIMSVAIDSNNMNYTNTVINDSAGLNWQPCVMGCYGALICNPAYAPCILDFGSAVANEPLSHDKITFSFSQPVKPINIGILVFGISDVNFRTGPWAPDGFFAGSDGIGPVAESPGVYGAGSAPDMYISLVYFSGDPYIMPAPQQFPIGYEFSNTPVAFATYVVTQHRFFETTFLDYVHPAQHWLMGCIAVLGNKQN